MKTQRLALFVAVSALGLTAPSLAEARLYVVATTPGLAALAQEVGGDRVEVESLSRGVQDPHFVDPNPTLAVKLRRADLLIDNGLDLEIGWLPPLVNQSRNPNIQPTGSRRLTAASFVHVKDIPVGPVDRSMGDLHPAGNPHFISDPEDAEAIAAGIAAKLSQLDPAGAGTYSARAADFKRRVDAALVRWRAELAPFRGREVVAEHQTMSYLLDWTGLVAAGYLEPTPGITPPPSHLADIIQVVRARGVKAILVENYYDPKFGQAVARYTSAKLVLIPGDVGGMPGTDTYERYVDGLVKLIRDAVR